MNWLRKLFTKKPYKASGVISSGILEMPRDFKPRATSGYLQTNTPPQQIKPYPFREKVPPRADEDDSFITSMAVAAATNSTLLGVAAGGSIAGAVLGDALNNSEESPAECPCDSPSDSSCDSSSDSSCDSGDCDSGCSGDY